MSGAAAKKKNKDVMMRKQTLLVQRKNTSNMSAASLGFVQKNDGKHIVLDMESEFFTYLGFGILGSMVVLTAIFLVDLYNNTEPSQKRKNRSWMRLRRSSVSSFPWPKYTGGWTPASSATRFT